MIHEMKPLTPSELGLLDRQSLQHGGLDEEGLELLKRLLDTVRVPDVVDGHWTTPEGREKAQEYALMRRSDLKFGDKPDLAMANAIYLVDRSSLDLIAFQTAAKERIRWLSVQLALAKAAVAEPSWQPIETAPKDGKWILAWCVHRNAQYATDPVAEGWQAPVLAQWIDHNGGGWTWNGLAGQLTLWAPVPAPPNGGGQK